MDYETRADIYLDDLIRHMKYPDKFTEPDLIAEFAAVERETRRRTLEEARDATCSRCRVAVPIHATLQRYHVSDRAPSSSGAMCGATAIRALLAAMDAEDAKGGQ